MENKVKSVSSEGYNKERIDWREVEKAPYRFDFYFLLRHLEASSAKFPRFGYAGQPSNEPVRMGQEPFMTFAPSTLKECRLEQGRSYPYISIYSFGLFGPNGPLPLHLTEYARERLRNHGDIALTRFADIFHHRFILFFYRAWAQSQATNSLDRPDDDHFTRYIASLSGFGQESLRKRDQVDDYAKFFFTGHLTRLTRNPEGLCSILGAFFSARVLLEEYLSSWLSLAKPDQTQLLEDHVNSRLGQGALVGQSVRDCQHQFRLRLGPLSLRDYELFLPGQMKFHQLLSWVRNYVGYEWEWDLRLVLRREDAPSAQIGGVQRLGWTTWLGKRREHSDADDLILKVESWAGRRVA
ncbi:MAG: type VI secretion system baseplate subunit TssG [Burkholderiales bacterium]|jgi:type VI secretion system protein ImpH|nr:type VI secretion system baseplate subunit TssG [Burkholderiales bacterium]